jgi:2-phospho-L-lactate guanylyltransferase (CobY/MobA/RfbA family)
VIFAFLPVKNPQNAQPRLHGFLSRAYREGLARLLYEQTIAALCQASGIDRDVLRLPGLIFDIDTPENAAELLVRAPDSPAASFLRTAGLSK